MSRRFDVIVAGGGPVGAALAIELTAAGFDAMLVDPREQGARSTDARPLALSYGSRLILERVDAWDALSPATPIERIHVSQRGAFGRAVLSAREAEVPALGYVVDYAGLVNVFDELIRQRSVSTERGARVTAIEENADGARVRYETAAGSVECDASLVVVADGGALAQPTAFDVRDYGQTAITARLRTSEPHGNVAYERFTAQGPVALLPYGEEYALVWTTASEEGDMLCHAPDPEFLSALQLRFGERVGRFLSVAGRAAHQLALRVARERDSERVVLVGNAAQSLHPVAGQGFNLGLRDVWELTRELREHGVRGGALQAYRARRRWDRKGGIAVTDTLVALFSNDFAPLALARGAGLALIDNLPPVKDFFVRRMMFGARG